VVELGHDQGGAVGAAGGRGGGEGGPRLAATFDLDELDGQATCPGDAPGDGGALRLRAEAGLAPPIGADAQIGNEGRQAAGWDVGDEGLCHGCL
jgi:hypothetical protein